MDEDFTKLFGTNIFNTASFDQFNKQAQESLNKFAGIINTAIKDVEERTITTTIGGSGGSTFKTTLKLADGDITNEFPNPVPDINNIYWIRHNELVTESLTTRKDIIMKVIETVGITISTIIKPISFGNIDFVKLAETFKKT
jgi:hypothetical protein